MPSPHYHLFENNHGDPIFVNLKYITRVKPTGRINATLVDLHFVGEPEPVSVKGSVADLWALFTDPGSEGHDSEE